MAVPEIKTEIKNEPLDITEDPEWEKAAEEEIMAANEGFNDEETESETEKNEKKVRPKRIRKPKLRDNFETDPDEPNEYCNESSNDTLDELQFNDHVDNAVDTILSNHQSDDETEAELQHWRFEHFKIDF